MSIFKRALVALSLCLGITSAMADQVLIIDAGYSTVTQNVQGRLEAAGHTVTVTTNTSLVPSSTGTYQQVWDLRYAAALTSGEQTAYQSFITGGGFAYFVTENPGCCMSRNNSVAALVTALGGGTTQIGPGWANNVETNMNTTYMTNGITVNYAAVAAIVNTQGIPLIQDSSGAVSGMSWIGRAGALASGVTGTIVTVADTNWLDSTRFVVGGSTAQQQNVQALDDIIRGVVAGTVAGTISSSGNGAGATNGNSGSAPTVVSTTTTNTSTSTDSRGSSTTSITTTNGQATVTDVVTRGVTTTVVVETQAKTAQTQKTLTVRDTFTTTNTTPITTVRTTVTPWTRVTTVTTPITTTTTTTPVTTVTMSDNTTVVTNGTPVVTTTTTDEVITTTTTGTTTASSTSTVNEVITTAASKDYSTNIDQYAQLSNINKIMNYSLDSNVLDRNRVLDDGFNVTERDNFYVTGSVSESNTVGGYSYKSNTYGLGYDWQVAKNWIVGGQFNRGQANLSGAPGNYSTGSLDKDHVGIYSAYTVEDWIFKNDVAYATNSFNTSHSIPQLGLSNTSNTKGQDMWATARVYTPEWNDLRPFVGVRSETNRRNAVTESGSALTAVSYGAVNNNVTSTDVGLRYDSQLAEDWRLTSEYAYNSQNFNTAYASIGYAIDPRSVVRLRYGYGKQYDYRVQTGMVEARFHF